MAEKVRSKTKHYHSTSEFQADRQKMLSGGWLVVDEDSTPGKARYDYGQTGSFVDLLFLPILWFFNRTQPERIVHVRYEKHKV